MEKFVVILLHKYLAWMVWKPNGHDTTFNFFNVLKWQNKLAKYMPNQLSNGFFQNKKCSGVDSENKYVK